MQATQTQLAGGHVGNPWGQRNQEGEGQRYAQAWRIFQSRKSWAILRTGAFLSCESQNEIFPNLTKITILAGKYFFFWRINCGVTE